MIRFLLSSTLLIASMSSVAVTIVAQESFADFEALGLRPGGGSGTLNSAHWRVTGASSGDSAFGDTITSGDLARGRSSGGVRSGGLYAFSLPEDKRGVGIQSTAADFTPGALIWSVANQSDRWLHNIILTFELWWLNNGARSSEIETQVSFDEANWLPLASTLTPLAADNLDWQSDAHVIALESIPNALSTSPHALPMLAPDSKFWLRWQFDDAAGSGSRDEFALTSLQVIAPPDTAAVTLNAPPTLWCTAVFTILLALRRYRAIANLHYFVTRRKPVGNPITGIL